MKVEASLAPLTSILSPEGRGGEREKHVAQLTAGVDEAGRGPLAGPVVVAAVILNKRRRINGLDDSKKLTAAKREVLYSRIVERAVAYSVVVIDREEIDRINIFQATMVGMTRALLGLMPAATEALIDGNQLPKNLPCPPAPSSAAMRWSPRSAPLRSWPRSAAIA